MTEKILVIDDERPSLDMSSLLLGAYGHTVLTALDGEEGLRVFAAERPPIVLTDIKMPGMDGLAVLERIKEMDPAAEVIVVTGHGDMDLAIRALNLGATDFINKPIGAEALESALRRAGERLRSARGEDGIRLGEEEGVTVIEINGSLTSDTEPFLKAAYERIPPRGRILLRFDRNSTINGAGIAALTQMVMAGARRHQTIAMTGLPGNFVRVFELVGITRFAAIHADGAKALAALRG